MDLTQTITLLHAIGKADGQAIPRLRAITPDRWNNILSELKLLGLAPLFFSRLANSPLSADLPPSVLQALQGEYLLHGARNTVLLDDLCSILETLRPLGITAIVLKGGCLAGTVYGDIALRPMRDIDILVRRRDLGEVQQVLINMGYGPAERPPVEEQCRMHHHLIPFTRAGGPPVEVHWSLTPAESGFQITMEDLEEETSGFDINGSRALMLSPGDLLIHLCLHICTNHCFSKHELRNLYDVAEVLRYYAAEIEWKALGERTRHFGVGRYVYSTLLVAGKIFGAALPREGLAELYHDDSDTEMAEVVAGYLLEDSAIRLPDMFAQLNVGNKPLRLLRALVPGLLPSYDYLGRKYGIAAPETPSRRALYYLRHWTETLARGVHLLGHLSLRSKMGQAAIRRRRQEAIIHRWLRSGNSA